MKLRLELTHEQLYDLYEEIKWNTDDKKIADIRREIFKVLEKYKVLEMRKVDNSKNTLI